MESIAPTPIVRKQLGTLPFGLLAALALCHAAFAGTADRAREAERARMVEHQIEGRGVGDPRVLAAMRSVPRHRFVPLAVRERAYDDRPLPIGHGQTISQPYVVAAMSELARISAGDRVLEVGTGSGYQAAVLAALGADVHSIELVAPLAKRAARTLRSLGFDRVKLRTGDGYRGWPEAAPFDAIVVTAAPPTVPRALLDQLAIGGRLVIPVGPDASEGQWLEVHERRAGGFDVDRVFPVRFVPMVPGKPADGDADLRTK